VKAERRRNNVDRERVSHATKKAHARYIKRLNRHHKSARLGHPHHLFKQGFWLSKINQNRLARNHIKRAISKGQRHRIALYERSSCREPRIFARSAASRTHNSSRSTSVNCTSAGNTRDNARPQCPRAQPSSRTLVTRTKHSRKLINYRKSKFHQKSRMSFEKRM